MGEAWNLIANKVRNADRRVVVAFTAAAVALAVAGTTLTLLATTGPNNETAFVPSNSERNEQDVEENTPAGEPPASSVPDAEEPAPAGSPTTDTLPGASPTTAAPGRVATTAPFSPSTSSTAPNSAVNTPQARPNPVLRLAASTTYVKPGERVSFSASNIPGSTRNIFWAFGDGATACADLGERPTHTYGVAARYEVQAVALNGPCGASPPGGAARGTIAITVRSNGGTLPAVAIEPGPGGVLPEDPHVTLDVDAADADGYVSRIVIDWNDGSAPSVLDFPLADCRDAPGSWPTSSHNVSFEHDYATAGTYNVTATVTSVGCDGGGAQYDTDTLSLTAGGMATGSPGEIEG